MVVFREAGPAAGPFPLLKGWHLHWELLQAHGAHTAMSGSPSCVFPALKKS